MNTTAPIVQTEVEVPIDPAGAFRLYTEGIDRWWRRDSPYWNEKKALGLRFEPYAGGRFIEVYDPVTGEGFEIGRVEIWEPGSRLRYTWRQADWGPTETTTVDITFSQTPDGTRLELRHTGWETVANGAEISAGYTMGSKQLLGWYAEVAATEAAATIG
jgi:uncharacterized protein YndB with AHSA1/START domain